MSIYCWSSFQSNHQENDANVPKLFLCVIFAQRCSTCTVTIILLLDRGVGEDDLKPFVNRLSSSRTRSRWADLPWREAQEWTHSCLLYWHCLYVIGCSSSSVTSYALPLTVICVLFCLKTGGHKGKYWTDICLPLRIFLQVRLYRFNLLCFVTNNTDLLPSLIWKTILQKKCIRKSNIRRLSVLFCFFRWNRRLKYLHESVTE